VLFEHGSLSAASFLDGFLDEPHPPPGVFQACEKNLCNGRGISLAEEKGIGYLLLPDKVLNIANEFRRQDALLPSPSQPFHKHGQGYNRTQDDGVHEESPSDNQVEHFTSPRLFQITDS